MKATCIHLGQADVQILTKSITQSNMQIIIITKLVLSALSVRLSSLFNQVSTLDRKVTPCFRQNSIPRNFLLVIFYITLEVREAYTFALVLIERMWSKVVILLLANSMTRITFLTLRLAYL